MNRRTMMANKKIYGWEPLIISNWTYSRSITPSGDNIRNDSSAISNYIAVNNGTSFRYVGALYDGSSNPFNSYLSEFNDKWKFVRRNPLLTAGTTSEVTVGSDCSYVIVSFARSMSTGIKITQTDLERYSRFERKENYL